MSVDKATEVVAEVAEEVADQATQIADISRGMSGHDIGLVFGGLVVGTGLGAVGGYLFCRRNLETKYNKIAEEEIAEMRQHYQDKTVSLENTMAKPKLEDLVREQGYSSEPPMAVTPPTAVVDAANDTEDEEPEVKNVFRREKVTPEEIGMPLVKNDWDYHKERVGRSPLNPYVIHRDELLENDIYDTVTFTYYEEDDVLCNERDEVVDTMHRDTLIGEKNLEKFGHGSGDASIVYIRNDKLEMQMEVVRSPNSYAEEVHGFQHSENPVRKRRRERSSPYDE